MFNKIRNRKSNKKGFTLIELIIVIAILGILAAILVPSMLNIVTNSRESVNEANARSVYSVASAIAIRETVNGTTLADGPADAAFLALVNADLGDGFDGTIVVNLAGGVVTDVTYDGVAWPKTTP